MRDTQHAWNTIILFTLLLLMLFSRFSEAGGLDKNWGLERIHLSEAQEIEKGGPQIVVAVIDTGFDAPAYPSFNVVPGWDFVTDKEGAWLDEHGHGTHVGGIIHAIAPGIQLMPLKYYSDMSPGSVNLANTVRCLKYAITHGARIINYSGGGPEPSEEEYLALKEAEVRGILVVSAAGNEHRDTDIPENKYYPAAYRFSNMVSVAAIDYSGSLSTSSNWGKLRVDLAAPGDTIYSTLPGGRYGYMSGTSQATAFVTGVAALVLSACPGLTPKQVREIILDTVQHVRYTLPDKILSGGVLDAPAALKKARSLP